MLKKMTFTFAATLALIISLSQSAIAQSQEYLAEEIESLLERGSYKTNMSTRAGFTGDSTEILIEGVNGANGGDLIVVGEPSYFQLFNRVKAVKCSPSVASGTVVANRNSCKETVYFGLNEPKRLSAGYYILGFENSIYPGFVRVTAGQQTRINLKKIAIGESARVYRNLTSPVEQKKLFFTQFQMGKAMFSLASYDFGGLYLRKFPLEDMMPNIEYSFCDMNWTQAQDPQAVSLCKAYKGKTFASMRPFFVFNNDGTHHQYVPRVPGDAFRYTLDRLLVSAPTNGAGSFVNVFPGDYIIEKTVGGKATTSKISVMDVTPSFGLE